VGGFVFRRCLRGDAGAVDMLETPAVSVEEMHNVEDGPHHEDHKQEI
jgi:hypothetical protein